MWLGAPCCCSARSGVLVDPQIALAVLLAARPGVRRAGAVPGHARAVRRLAQGRGAAGARAAVRGARRLADARARRCRCCTRWPQSPGQLDPHAAMAFFMIGAVHCALMSLVLEGRRRPWSPAGTCSALGRVGREREPTRRPRPPPRAARGRRAPAAVPAAPAAPRRRPRRRARSASPAPRPPRPTMSAPRRRLDRRETRRASPATAAAGPSANAAALARARHRQPLPPRPATCPFHGEVQMTRAALLSAALLARPPSLRPALAEDPRLVERAYDPDQVVRDRRQGQRPGDDRVRRGRAHRERRHRRLAD